MAIGMIYKIVTSITSSIYYKLEKHVIHAHTSSEGVIIEWPLNGLFNNGRDVIIPSQMAVIIIFLRWRFLKISEL